MSSYGGETPVRVLKVSSPDGGSGIRTPYTVPAGRYAKLKIAWEFVPIGGGGGSPSTIQIGDIEFLTSDSTIVSGGPQLNSHLVYPYEYWLQSGQSINITTQASSNVLIQTFDIQILEFNNP